MTLSVQQDILWFEVSGGETKKIIVDGFLPIITINTALKILILINYIILYKYSSQVCIISLDIFNGLQNNTDQLKFCDFPFHRDFSAKCIKPVERGK